MFDGFVALCVGELWVRSFIPVNNICWYIDNKIGARYCPNQRTYGYVEKGYSNIFITNSLGFHDIERTIEKEKGVYRIQIYGDSMVGGTQVKIDETVNAYVERYLNSLNLPYSVEVINMAAGDESTSSEIMTYKEVGKQFNPDMVLCYFMNDFPENVFETHRKEHIPYHKIDQNGKLQYTPPVPKDTKTLFERFKRTSHMYRLTTNKILMSKAYHNLKEVKRTISDSFKKRKSTVTKKDNCFSSKNVYQDTMINTCWPLTLRLIEHFSEISENDGAKFILVDGMEFTDSTVARWYSNSDFQKLLSKKGIHYIPIYPIDSELRKPLNRAKYVFKDNHFNNLGNERIGLELAKKLVHYLPSELKNRK